MYEPFHENNLISHLSNFNISLIIGAMSMTFMISNVIRHRPLEESYESPRIFTEYLGSQFSGSFEVFYPFILQHIDFVCNPHFCVLQSSNLLFC
jgi:hypothetical protein